MIFVFIVLFISCQNKNEKTIESIKVWYYNELFDRAMAVGCDEIVYLPEKVDTLDVLLQDGSFLPKPAAVLESIVTNKEILQEIAIELSKQKVINEDYTDTRMKCYISFNNGQTDSLCIGNVSIYGNYNGQPVKLTNKFVYLIRKSCGFYRWIGADNLKYFDELNDTTFVRAKVKSRWGGEY
jgi:hypothetical protein